MAARGPRSLREAQRLTRLSLPKADACDERPAEAEGESPEAKGQRLKPEAEEAAENAGKIPRTALTKGCFEACHIMNVL